MARDYGLNETLSCLIDHITTKSHRIYAKKK